MEGEAWSVLLRVCRVEPFRRLWVLRSVLHADKVSWLFYTLFECGGFTGLRIFLSLTARRREVWMRGVCSFFWVRRVEPFRRLWVLRSVLRADCAR